MPSLLRNRVLARLVVGAAALTLALTGTSAAIAATAPQHSPRPHSPSAPTVESPQVVHTGRAPTGYSVTFRYYDKTAKSVQIKGEWYFSNPAQLSKLSGSSDTDVVASQGVLPSQWKPGDVPLAYPNSTAANWPVVQMKQVGHSGVWTYTTPLPSGVFNYGFFVNCTAAGQVGCTQLTDPSNPPFNKAGTGIQLPAATRRSQVYVPSDPKFDTVDLSYQAPNKEHGTLTDVAYPSATTTAPGAKNYATVYTPPGYDPKRKQAYPTLYLLAPDDEVAWATQGDIGNILDNLIDTGEMQPVVMVSPDIKTIPASSDSSIIDTDLIGSLIPFVEKRYDVSTVASQRAVAAMGNESSVVNSLLFEHTTEFGYYGAWGNSSTGPYTLPAASAITSTQLAALKKVGISIGGGYQDPHHWYHANEIALLSSVGVPVTPDFVNSGHDWYSWRINAKNFLTQTAFFPLSTGPLQAG